MARGKVEVEGKRPEPTVGFTVSGDGLALRSAPWGFIGRLPVSVDARDGKPRSISLKVACETTAVMVWTTRSYAGQIEPVKPVFSAGEEIQLTVRDGLVESGEPVLCIHPLLFG